jgi:hypothetical protein
MCQQHKSILNYVEWKKTLWHRLCTVGQNPTFFYRILEIKSYTELKLCSDDVSPNESTWTFRPLDDASLGRCVPR